MMAKFREVDGNKLSRNTKNLKDLPIGSLVAIQNQSGWYPTKWDKTGVVVEVRPMNRLWSRWMEAEDGSQPAGASSAMYGSKTTGFLPQ